MGLHLADCHLEYARLFLARLPERSAEGAQSKETMTEEGLKAKARKHWEIAKDMINKMGYHRRDKEVEEIEKQL